MRRGIARFRFFLLAIGAAHCGLHAQSAARRFDVASVRPNHIAGCRGRWDFRVSHGRLTAENAPLLRIISRAYNLTDDRVSGPAWMDSECYDIQAKASGDVPDRDLMPMLRQLLKERFQLAAHLESGVRPIFALVADKGGVKLHPYGYKTANPASDKGGRILFMARHLPDLCERLGKVTGRPVIDKTGLDGDYLIALTYLPLDASDRDPSDSEYDIFSAVRLQLGLRLEPQRGAVNILKIDSLNKVPADN